MECNKDEAMRAKEIAEKKLLERDLNGAKKYALKAQSLFPKLDGLSRFFDIINVYLASEIKINEEPDYYAILGVDPWVDQNTLKHKYRKLALSLHPDKTSLVGAEGAFKIMSQAWTVLSDRDSRNAYNFRRIMPPTFYGSYVGSMSASRTASATSTQPAPAPQRNMGMGTVYGTNTQPVHAQQRNQGTATSQQGNAQYFPSYYGSQGFPQTPTMPTAAGSQYNTGPSIFRQPLYCSTAKNTADGNLHDSSANPNIQNNPAQGSNGMSKNSAASVPSQTHSKKHKKASAKATPEDSNQAGPSKRRPRRPRSNPLAFWACCKNCNAYFEYYKIYLNQHLLCIKCQQAFFAMEVRLPKKGTHMSAAQYRRDNNLPSSQTVSASATETSQGNSTLPQSGNNVKGMNEDETKRGKGNKANTENINTETAQNEGASTQNAATSGLNRTKKRKRVDGQKDDSSKDVLKRAAENVELPADSALKKDKPMKKRRVDGQKGNNSKEKIQGNADKVEAGDSRGLSKEKPENRTEIDGPMTGENSKNEIGGPSKKSGHKKKSEKQKGDNGAGKSSSIKDLSQSELRATLIRKAKMEIMGHLMHWESEKKEKEESTKDPVNVMQNDFNHPKTKLQPKKSSTLKEIDGADAIGNTDKTVSMAVPDANFHNFDEERVENSFSENQVWAAYDSADGMPRLYALVQHVVSRSPFKLKISWLDANSTSEFGPLDWLGNGFTKTNGDFKLAKSVTTKRLNSFSHAVKWRKGARGVIQIFPAEGDVWALYKNWCPDWNETTADDVIRKYEMVEVLEDYSVADGILVAPLVKVAGFTSIFSQIPEQILTWKIPKEEMFRFSHQVPVFQLKGLEDKNVPDGCYELDPAALPLELLKVITEAEAAEAAEERGFEHLAMLRERGSEGGSVEPVVYHRRNKWRRTEGSVDRSDGQTFQDES